MLLEIRLAKYLRKNDIRVIEKVDFYRKSTFYTLLCVLSTQILGFLCTFATVY